MFISAFTTENFLQRNFVTSPKFRPDFARFLPEINFILLNILCCIRNSSEYEEFGVSSISNEIEIRISIKMFQGLLHINMLDGIEIKNLLMARTCKFKYTYDFEEA